MGDKNGFYTLKGYQYKERAELTPAMEDYLEMICRSLCVSETVRIGELATKLHVKPSSATKIVQQLALTGYVDSQRYADVRLTDKGREAGAYLMYRHSVLERFLKVLNNSEDELTEVEKIEHFFDVKTIENLDALTQRLEAERV